MTCLLANEADNPLLALRSAVARLPASETQVFGTVGGDVTTLATHPALVVWAVFKGVVLALAGETFFWRK